METVYLISAVTGGTILIIQTILLLMGGGDGSDVDSDGALDGADVHDVDMHGGDVHDIHDQPGHGDAYQATFLKVLSFKTLVAFFTFFGLGGLACQKAEFSWLPTLLIALGAGSVALYLVAYLMSLLYRLQSRGNLNLANAVGQIGKVYLRIPPERSGTGKVNVVDQGRLVECKATTSGPEIPTGTEVRVVARAGPNMLEVLPVGKE